MSHIMQRALDFLRPHRAHRLYPLCFVSEVTCTNAKRVFEFLSRETELGAEEIDLIKRLIDECPKTEVRNVFRVVNWDGFTLLQRAVINNHVAVVKLLIKKGCDVNAGICSLPLHLACKRGHVHVAQLLLTYGARAHLECTVCFPEEHNLSTYPDQIYCLAYQPVYTPVMYALVGDHEQVLRLLLHHENARHCVKTDFLLHDACRMGAHQCSRYLLERYSEQMWQENIDGKTPLQISLVTDADSAIFLMDNGADFKENVFLTENGSTLHELYRSKMTLGLVKATQFALDHGFRSHINIRDEDGNTALYVLLRHAGRTVKSHIQSDYDYEVEECLKLLLVFGANPNIPNRVGESALHVVLSDNAARKLYVSRHGHVRRLKPLLQEICNVVEILLAHGAADISHSQRAATTPAVYVSPLYYAIRIFQSLQPDMFVVVKTALKQLLVLLANEHCNVNAADSCGQTPLLMLLSTASKWIASAATNATFCRTIMPFIGDVITHLQRRGLDANAQLTYWTRRMDEAIESTYYKELVIFLNMAVPCVQYYDDVRRLIVTLTQRGGNPNLLVFTPCYGATYGAVCVVPREASLVLLLTRALYVQTGDTLPAVLEVLAFFYRTLTQRKLVEFVNGVTHVVNTDFKRRPVDDSVHARLVAMAEAPRPLKDLCRVAIADSLDWKLSKRCAKLPLPRLLLQFIVNLDT